MFASEYVFMVKYSENWSKIKQVIARRVSKLNDNHWNIVLVFLTFFFIKMLLLSQYWLDRYNKEESNEIVVLDQILVPMHNKLCLASNLNLILLNILYNPIDDSSHHPNTPYCVDSLLIK